jgi:DNA polymerase III delta prime subunit
MHALILVSTSLDLRVEEINRLLKENNLTEIDPDVLIFSDTEKLGVDSAKKIRQFLSIKPLKAKGKVVVFKSAHNLTMDAQNALLKTLEEPPVNSLLILGVESTSNLLQTVLSRCQIKVLDQIDRVKIDQMRAQQFIDSTIEERFEFIEKLEDKDIFLTELANLFQTLLLKDPKNLNITKKILEAETWLKHKGNSRAILEYLALELG